MTSNKQKRAQLDAKKQARKYKAAAEKRDAQRELLEQKAVEQVLVETSKLSPDNSYGFPEFVTRGYYVDQPFRCCDCGVDEVWTARQQKWWYEIAKGDRWTIAKRCRACRKSVRQRSEAATRKRQGGVGQQQDQATATSQPPANLRKAKRSPRTD